MIVRMCATTVAKPSDVNFISKLTALYTLERRNINAVTVENYFFSPRIWLLTKESIPVNVHTVALTAPSLSIWKVILPCTFVRILAKNLIAVKSARNHSHNQTACVSIKKSTWSSSSNRPEFLSCWSKHRQELTMKVALLQPTRWYHSRMKMRWKLRSQFHLF